jgi:V/A-type H+-transporting ATPase subunit F
MFDKVAVVGEADIIFALRALGVKIFSPKSLEEARKVMESIAKENFALCFLHESFLEPLREEREALREKFCPVVVGFSDYRKVTDQLERMMRDVAIKATGSDSLVKRREEDERR